MRSIHLIVFVAILLAACGESALVTTTIAAAPSTVPTTVAITTPPADPPTEELRELALAYWDAFNGYDADRVLSYLEETYRTSREEIIRAEIDQVSTFGVELGVTEESPPVMLGDDAAEMYLELKNPLGVRRIRMAFELIDAEWMITFAEETD
jgi:hypothetical protein